MWGITKIDEIDFESKAYKSRKLRTKLKELKIENPLSSDDDEKFTYPIEYNKSFQKNMKKYKGKTFAKVDMIVRNIRADYIRKVYSLLIVQYFVFILLIMI